MNDNGASDMMISRRLWLAQASGCGPGSHSATALVLEYGEQEYWLRSRFAWRRQLSAAGEPAWFASWLDTETGARQREAWRSSLPVSQRADLWRVRNLQCCMPPETLSNHTEQTLCSPYSGKPLLHLQLQTDHTIRLYWEADCYRNIY